MTADLPPLRDVIARYDIGARKALGQHFLLDLNITRKIARAADVVPGDRVLEIGPGPGGLTRALLEAGADVVAVERDARCVAALQELAAAFPGKLTVVEGDALRFDEREIARDAPIKIVANLPYNISTELLVKWLKANRRESGIGNRESGIIPGRHSGHPFVRGGMDGRDKPGHGENENSIPDSRFPIPGRPIWSVMALMFQKEVADRILASPRTKAYGRLSVIAQAASRPEKAFDLPARAFTPPPKVDSTVVLFRPADDFIDVTALETVTGAAFGQRRKMLRSSLGGLFGADLRAALASIGAAETQRAEELTVAQFVALAQGL